LCLFCLSPGRHVVRLPSIQASSVGAVMTDSLCRFIDDLAYWGGEYNVHSPKDPLVLVDNTCISYSAEDVLAKRDSSESLVENGDGEGCFGGLVSCKADSGDTPCMPMGDSGSSKRVNPPCYNVPALWYNCDFFGDTTIINRNQHTNQVKPTETFMGKLSCRPL